MHINYEYCFLLYFSYNILSFDSYEKQYTFVVDKKFIVWLGENAIPCPEDEKINFLWLLNFDVCKLHPTCFLTIFASFILLLFIY